MVVGSQETRIAFRITRRSSSGHKEGSAQGRHTRETARATNRLRRKSRSESRRDRQHAGVARSPQEDEQDVFRSIAATERLELGDAEYESAVNTGNAEVARAQFVGLISQAFFLSPIAGQVGTDRSSATANPRGSGNPLQTTSLACGKRICHAFAVIDALLLLAQTGDLISPVTT